MNANQLHPYSETGIEDYSDRPLRMAKCSAAGSALEISSKTAILSEQEICVQQGSTGIKPSYVALHSAHVMLRGLMCKVLPVKVL